MHALKFILLVLLGLLIVFIVVVALQPDDFRIERSAVMAAPPASIFDRVNDFHNWSAWSPWARLDPAMRETYSGASAGTGAVYDWSGNSKVGQGRMTITESRSPELVRIKLEFIKPFASTNAAEFTFRPQGNETLVTWSMSGRKNFLTKAFGLFANMDKLLGGDFERGLAQLNQAAQAGGARP